jgi:hypothetical protein
VEHHGKSAPQEDAASPQEVESSKELGLHLEIEVSQEVEACGEKVASQRMALQVEGLEEKAHDPPQAMA